MEKIIQALQELHEINTSYDLSNETVERLLKETEGARVCTPVIGKFSSGKSALLNTLLGYSRKILKEDITPETAVPCEITYATEEDSIFVVYNNGERQKVSVNEFRELEADANTVRCSKLQLKNSFLEKIPDVMLVDMPGFESGFEVHNKAIDNYLPQSLAYIITFPADDMIVRSSVGSILKELCLHDMPICITITKFDKRNHEFEETFSALKESLKKYIGNREVTYCITSSFSGDAEELEEFLKGIQENSREILANRFKNGVLSAADTAEMYLKTTLKNFGLSESELAEQEEKLTEQLDSMNSRFSKEKADFDIQISECVEEIKSDVQMALEGEESTLVIMAMNHQDIGSKINTIARNAVTVSMKKRFIPKVQKYLKRISSCMETDSLQSIPFSPSFNEEDVEKNIVSAVVAGTAALLLGGPLIGAVVAGLMLIANKLSGDKKREEMKSKIRMQLTSEVFPKVLQEVGRSVKSTIAKQLELINTSIEQEITAQRTSTEKALADIRQKREEEQESKEALTEQMGQDMEKIQFIRNELQ